MKSIKVEMKDKTYSTIYFATKLVSEVSRYSSEVVLKSISENGTKQEVDLKSILGVSAVLANKAAVLEIELRGENENYEAPHLQTVIKRILEESSN